MNPFVRSGLTLLALAVSGQTTGFAQELESKLQNEPKLTEVDTYLTSDSIQELNQVTSVTAFSDVQPTDWAYQALQNLVEQYGCVAGYPDASFRGNKSISRYEAAALLNTCLDSVTVITDDLKTLLIEFEFIDLEAVSKIFQRDGTLLMNVILFSFK